MGEHLNVSLLSTLKKEKLILDFSVFYGTIHVNRFTDFIQQIIFSVYPTNPKKKLTLDFNIDLLDMSYKILWSSSWVNVRPAIFDLSGLLDKSFVTVDFFVFI